jgi:hypothetical protein
MDEEFLQEFIGKTHVGTAEKAAAGLAKVRRVTRLLRVGGEEKEDGGRRAPGAGASAKACDVLGGLLTPSPPPLSLYRTLALSSENALFFLSIVHPLARAGWEARKGKGITTTLRSFHAFFLFFPSPPLPHSLTRRRTSIFPPPTSAYHRSRRQSRQPPTTRVQRRRAQRRRGTMRDPAAAAMRVLSEGAVAA